MTFEIRFTNLRGEQRDGRRYDALEDALQAAMEAFRPVQEGGIEDVLAAHIYENPAPTLRMVVSAGYRELNSLVHVTQIGPTGERYEGAKDECVCGETNSRNCPVHGT